LNPKTGVELEITAKPFQGILENLESGSRSAYRQSLGIEDSADSQEPQQISGGVPPCEYHDDDDLIVDGEVVDQDEDDGPTPFCGPDGAPWAEEPTPFGPSGPQPDQGMVSLSDAVATQADMRKAAVLRPIQRALPRGRT